MISRRTIVNLVVFFGLTTVLIGYGFFSLIQNPLNRPMTLYSYIDDTGGVRSGFTVAMRGVPIGNVESLALTTVGATQKIKLAIGIDHGVKVPRDAKVQVERANPLGEQQVDLLPSGADVPPAKEGDVLQPTETPTPPDVGQLVDAADRLFASVPTDQLGIVIHELAVAFNGRADDIRTLINASDQFSRTTLAYSDQFRALLANSPPVLDTVAAVGPQLHQALANTEVLADLLQRRAPDIVNLFKSGTAFATAANQLLDASSANLACLAKDIGDVGANLGTNPNYTNLDTSLLINQGFFGPVDGISPTGHAQSLGAGSATRDTQTWLRVRLLLPPQSPAAVSYTAAHHIPDSYPGAACLSVFGNGVPAASQANPSPQIEGSHLIPAAAPTVPVEQRVGPTPLGGGSGPGNVFASATAAGVGNVTRAASTTAVNRAASRPGTAPQAHPETLLLAGFGVAGLGLLESREIKRLRKAYRRSRRRG